MIRSRCRSRAWPAMLLALLLVGCGESGMMRGQAEVEAQRAEARALLEQGRHQEAAQRLEGLLESAPQPLRFSLATEAAQAYAAAGAVTDALRVLPSADTAGADEDWLEWAPLAARLLLEAGRADEALEALQRLPDEPPAAVARESLLLRAEAQFALGRVRAGTEALLARERHLTTQSDVLDNHRLLWRHLQAGGDAVLEAARSAPADPDLAGWLALGEVGVNATRNPAGLIADVMRWRGSHPEHAANAALIDEVLAAYRGLMSFPRQLALLLPLSGPQQGAGVAVRDGVLAAYFEHIGDIDPQERANIRIYDTGAASAQEVYRQALRDGADFIVGPLLRESVDGITGVSGSVPTLALNRLSDGLSVPPLFYQFALSPEEEAQQAARLAMERHGGRAIAMVPNDDWGRRLLASFELALEEAGGRLLEHSTYNPWEQDFSTPITRLLQVDQSEQRRQRLAANIGANVLFEPRRRQDADFLFLAARTPEARLIRPQLRYYFAADMPVYSTSAVFEPTAGADEDLNGIIFADAPWLLAPDTVTRQLRDQVERHWPQRGRQLGRLYAMGFDAYSLVPLLFASGGNGELPALDGMSGRLQVDASGLVQRTLTWAQFRNGRPQPLALPALSQQGRDQPGIAAGTTRP